MEGKHETAALGCAQSLTPSSGVGLRSAALFPYKVATGAKACVFFLHSVYMHGTALQVGRVLAKILFLFSLLICSYSCICHF